MIVFNVRFFSSFAFTLAYGSFVCCSTDFVLFGFVSNGPAGFGEDWLKLLLSRVCLEESQLPVLFSKLHIVVGYESEGTTNIREDQFSSEQAFLLRMASEIVNEQIGDITVTNDVALFVFGIFKKCIGVLDFVPSAIK